MAFTTRETGPLASSPPSPAASLLAPKSALVPLIGVQLDTCPSQAKRPDESSW